MPLTTHSSDEEGLATIKADGAVSWDDLQQALRELMADSGFNPSLPHLIDLRAATLHLVDDEMDGFGMFFTGDFGAAVGGSIAMVISDQLSTADCANLYRVLCDLANAELFDDYDLAMRWVMKREFVSGGVALNATVH